VANRPGTTERVSFATGLAAAGLVWRAAPIVVPVQVALAVVAAAVPVLVAWLTKQLIDTLTGDAPTPAPLLWTAGGLVAAGLLLALLPRIGEFLDHEASRAIALRAHERLYAAAERFLGLARFENPEFLDRLRLAQQMGGRAPGQLVTSGTGLIGGAVTATGFLGSLVVINPVLAVVVLVAAVPALIAQLRLSRQRARMMWTLEPVERREFFYGTLLADVQAAKELRLFGAGEFVRGRMLSERRTADAEKRRMDLRDLLAQGGLSALSAAVAGAALVWAIVLAFRGVITPGDVTMLVAAVGGVQGSLTQVTMSVSTAHHQLLLFGHYHSVVRAGPDLPSPVRPAAVPALRRGIELRDVWFRYSDGHPWALSGVNLHIPAGEAVGLVGRNGAGKSTLVKLLCRFYDPTRGAILWDGVDLREMDTAALRRRIGAVFQDFMQYDLTAAENIAIGDIDALPHQQRLVRAAQLAGIHDELVVLPHGYDTLLSRMFFSERDKSDPDTGVVLSGGQWQRLALARAMLRDGRDLLILDEPSSGLDAMAEHEVDTRLREHREGRTSVLISHRLGAVRDADRLVVLDDGVVAEQGTHDELIAAGGLYAELFGVQAAGYLSHEQPPNGRGTVAAP
jgi:ATP-binding cassette subfamily B protein